MVTDIPVSYTDAIFRVEYLTPVEQEQADAPHTG